LESETKTDIIEDSFIFMGVKLVWRIWLFYFWIDDVTGKTEQVYLRTFHSVGIERVPECILSSRARSSACCTNVFIHEERPIEFAG